MTSTTMITRTAAWRAGAAAELAALAARVLDGDPGTTAAKVRATVRACCPDLPGDAVRARLWEDYLHRAGLEQDIEAGTVPWQAVDESLTCGERTEAAREIARADTAGALAALLGGTP